MKTAKIRKTSKPKSHLKHTGKIWPGKRKANVTEIKECNKENKPACKKEILPLLDNYRRL